MSDEPTAEAETAEGGTAEDKAGAFDSLRHPVIVVLAIAVGAAVGAWSEATGRALAPFGSLYLSLLLMCVIPLLFTAIISSLGQMVARHRLGRQLAVIFVVFAIGLVLSAAIGTLVGWATGVGADLRQSEALGNLLLATETTGGAGGVEDLAAAGPGQAGAFAELFSGIGGEPEAQGARDESRAAPESPRGFLAYLTQLIPRNLASAVLEENYLAVLFFSVLMGLAIGYAPAEGRGSALRVIETLFDALLRIINWIIFLLPLGLVCIVAGEVARGGLDFVPVLGKLIAVSAVTTAVALLLFALTIWMAVGGRLFDVFRGVRAPLVVAFATSSSMASIPAAMIALKRQFGLAEENVKLLLPLGVMMNPMGSALFFSLSAIFAVQLHAQAPGFHELHTLAMIVVGSVLAGLAAMGLPGPSAVWMLGIILEPIGVPPEVGIIALLAVAPIIDPLFTMVNVLGNCTATCILDKRMTPASASS